jgi:hypothetical protein
MQEMAEYDSFVAPTEVERQSSPFWQRPDIDSASEVRD